MRKLGKRKRQVSLSPLKVSYGFNSYRSDNNLIEMMWLSPVKKCLRTWLNVTCLLVKIHFGCHPAE